MEEPSSLFLPSMETEMEEPLFEEEVPFDEKEGMKVIQEEASESLKQEE